MTNQYSNTVYNRRFTHEFQHPGIDHANSLDFMQQTRPGFTAPVQLEPPVWYMPGQFASLRDQFIEHLLVIGQSLALHQGFKNEIAIFSKLPYLLVI